MKTLFSRTAGGTVGADLAHRFGVPFAERNIFLDNINTVDYVRDRLKELLEREREVNRLIRACVDDCIEEGSIATTDAEMLAYQIVVTVHAWSHSAWRLEKGLDVATYVERNLSVLLGPVLAGSQAAAD